MNKFIKSLTPLSLVLLIYYSILIVYTIWNYTSLSSNEGWGIVYMFGLSLIGIPAIITELLIRAIVKNRSQKYKWGIIFLSIYVLIMLFLGFN